MKEFVPPFRQVKVERFIVFHSLAKPRADTIPDNADKVVVPHPTIDIESIRIVHIFWDCIRLFEITNLVKTPGCLVIVARVFPDGILSLFLSIVPLLISFLPFQHVFFSA